MQDRGRPRGLLLSEKLNFRRDRSLLFVLFVLGASSCVLRSAGADDFDDAQALFNSGKYAECIETTAARIDQRAWRESWRRLKIRAELATGRYCDALATLEMALERFPSSIHLRLLGREVYLFNDWPERADERLLEAEQMIRQQSWRYSDPINRVLLGRFFLLRGADAKQVLDTFFDRARRDRPDYVETYLASG